VFNWLFARHHQGEFVLRVEDTDQVRSRPEYTQNMIDGLTWLGLTWDQGPFFQSERLDLYRQGIQTLLDRGLAYRCYCTPEELDAMRAEQKAKGQAPRYDNRHRDLTPDQEAAFVAEGRSAVIRFKIEDDREIAWNDLVRGWVTWKGRDLGGDMVIARAATGEDMGQPLYNFVVVVDDLDMKISHVIRGEDHIGNTPKQILLYEALGATAPEFGHTPLILNESGQKLSKRDGVTSISDFRDKGYTPEALANYMTLLGWSPPEPMTERFSLAEATPHFGFDRVNKAGAKFDWAKLNWLNSQVLHELAPGELVEQLRPVWQGANYDFAAVDQAWLEQLVALIGPSLETLPDGIALSRFYVAAAIDLDEEATKQVQQPGASTVLEALLAPEVSLNGLTQETAQALIKQVVKEHKLKKGLVMRTLRGALMGAMKGPDMLQSWLLLNQRGWDRSRLQAALTISQG
jgi:glutamyl-tRNA synthetase